MRFSFSSILAESLERVAESHARTHQQQLKIRERASALGAIIARAMQTPPSRMQISLFSFRLPTRAPPEDTP